MGKEHVGVQELRQSPRHGLRSVRELPFVGVPRKIRVECLPVRFICPPNKQLNLTELSASVIGWRKAKFKKIVGNSVLAAPLPWRLFEGYVAAG